jgi:hypothetical protein
VKRESEYLIPYSHQHGYEYCSARRNLMLDYYQFLIYRKYFDTYYRFSWCRLRTFKRKRLPYNAPYGGISRLRPGAQRQRVRNPHDCLKQPEGGPISALRATMTEGHHFPGLPSGPLGTWGGPTATKPGYTCNT